jgi:basic membrane protein A
MKHHIFRGLRIAVGMAALAVPQIALAQDDVKFAIVLPGVITDNSFNQAGYEGALAASEALGLEMAYSEKVAQPDQPEALADYARRGYNVVIGHGSEFQDAAERVARRNPDTSFLVVNGSEASDNISTVGYNYRHLAYGLGLTAGEMSESGIGGFVGGQPIPFSTDLLEGYTAGFMAANPDGQVLSAWTSDWDDVAKGKEATLNLISQGADIIFPTMDNATIGSLQAMQEQGVQGFGIYYDAIEDWPDVILQSAIFDLSGAMTAVLSNIEDGTLPSQAYEFGFETPEAARFGTFHSEVSAAVQDKVNAAIAGMIAGEINP